MCVCYCFIMFFSYFFLLLCCRSPTPLPSSSYSSFSYHYTILHLPSFLHYIHSIIFKLNSQLVFCNIYLISPLTHSQTQTHTCSLLQMMKTNLRGEMTCLAQEEGGPVIEEGGVRELDVVASISRALQLASADDVDQVKDLLLPAIFFAAVVNEDLTRLEEIYNNVGVLYRFFFIIIVVINVILCFLINLSVCVVIRCVDL